MKVLIIGASHSGITCALHLKQINPQIEVTLIEKNEFHSFISSGINLLQKRLISNLENAAVYKKANILDANIRLLDKTSVIKILPKLKKVALHHLDSDEKENLDYDILVIATGSKQTLLDFGFTNDPRFISYKTFEESEASLKVINEAKRVAIIGAGFIGIELADWAQREKDLYLIERMDRPLFRYLDDDMVAEVFAKPSSNFHLKVNNSVTKVTENPSGKLDLTLFSGEVIQDIDCVISAINGRPNTQLYEELIDLNYDKTIIVNSYLQTSDPEIYAVGDVVSQRLLSSQLENNNFFLPLVTNALRSGYVVAENIVRHNYLTFQHTNRTIVTKFGPYYLGSTGLNNLDLITRNLETKSYIISFSKSELTDLADGMDYIRLKLIINQTDKVLIGAQLVTTNQQLMENINLLSLMITTKQTLMDIIQADFYFQPEIKPHLNIVQRGALKALETI